ncbi:MAG: hypothetical protein ACLFUU_13595, partial [Desulfobacteraceae bacterium]
MKPFLSSKIPPWHHIPSPPVSADFSLPVTGIAVLAALFTGNSRVRLLGNIPILAEARAKSDYSSGWGNYCLSNDGRDCGPMWTADNAAPDGNSGGPISSAGNDGLDGKGDAPRWSAGGAAPGGNCDFPNNSGIPIS